MHVHIPLIFIGKLIIIQIDNQRETGRCLRIDRQIRSLVQIFRKYTLRKKKNCRTLIVHDEQVGGKNKQIYMAKSRLAPSLLMCLPSTVIDDWRFCLFCPPIQLYVHSVYSISNPSLNAYQHTCKTDTIIDILSKYSLIKLSMKKIMQFFFYIQV